MSAPIFEATLRDHGLRVEPRPLGAVSTGLHLIHDATGGDARGTQALYRRLVSMLVPHGCPRCDNGSGATCAACLAEIQMRDDDESHARECARYEAAWSALGDDTDEWGDL